MKKITRRSFLKCTAVLAGTAALSACGSATSASTALSAAGSSAGTATGEPIDMLLWLPPNGADDASDQTFWEETLTPWAKENNVNLSLEITPWSNYEEKYLTAFSSGEGPDVGYMYLEMFNDFIDMGALLDVDSYFTDDEKSNYLYWDKGNMKGGQYAVPFIVGNARILYFNMDLLGKAGVTTLPGTWEEFVETLVKIKDANLGVDTFQQCWADPTIGSLNEIFYPFFWQAGGELYNDEGKIALLDNDAAVTTAQWLLDLKDKYGVLGEDSMSLSEGDVKEAFTNGQVAVACMPTNRASSFTEAGINWGFVSSLENKTKAIWVASDALIVNAATKNPDMAAKLIKFITSGDVMTAYHQQIAAFPPITKDEKYNDNAAFEDMYTNQTQYFKTLPVASGSFKMMDTLYKNLQLVMLGELAPQDAIQQTVDYANSL